MTVVGCWADLVPRLLSSLVMVTLGGAALYTGGIILAILMSAVCAVMIWEVIGLLAPQRGKRPVVLAILFGVVFFFYIHFISSIFVALQFSFLFYFF